MNKISKKKLARASFLINEWILDFEASVMGEVIDELKPFKKANIKAVDLVLLISYLLEKIANVTVAFPKIRAEEIEFLEIFSGNLISDRDVKFINKQMKKFNSHSK